MRRGQKDSRTLACHLQKIWHSFFREFWHHQLRVNVSLARRKKWRIVDSSDGIHPLHIHVISFEAMVLLSDLDYHRLHDTIWLPLFSTLRCGRDSKPGRERPYAIATCCRMKIPAMNFLIS
jgi:hypothetical protein